MSERRTMHLWYPLLALICHFVFCCEAHNKGTTTDQREESLLKFFNLNNDDPDVRNAAINLTNKSEILHSPRKKCGLLVKEKCAHKLKSKSNNVKKSFRPHDYDEDDDDYDEDDESPDDEEFPEEDEAGSYRSYEDLMSRPRDHERLYGDESEEDEEPEPRHDRPGHEDGTDDDIDADWDWDSPRRHYGRHGRERWRPHHTPDYDDDYEPNYSPHHYRHYPRRSHYHHHHHYRAPAHDSYRTFSHTAPSWLTYPQGYSGGATVSTPVLSSYLSNRIGTGWQRRPASYNTRWQPRYYPLQAAATNTFNAQLAGSNNWNPYQQKMYSYPQRESNSFYIPPYPVSSSSYLQATTRNHPGFSNPYFLPGIATTVPRLSNHIYHYPRLISRSRHFTGPFSRSFPGHREFSDAVLNRIRDLNLH